MLLRTIAIAASVLGLFACSQSASSDADANATAGDEAAIVATSCTPAAYNKGLARYKNAVAAAKRHAASRCDDDNSYLSDIASEAQAAVTECAAFSTVIKTSIYAAPIRSELATSGLVLAQLTGDLKVRNSAGQFSYDGLKASLEKGATMWGPAPGVYGNMTKLEFAADGKVKAYSLNIDNDVAPVWVSSEGTYRVGNVDGDTVLITVSVNGISIDYDFKATSESNIPDFELTPVGGEGPPEAFRAYISECEA